MLRTAALVSLSALTAALVSCGGSTDATPSQKNSAPTWPDAPSAAIKLGQGQTRLIPLTVKDADGDKISVKATPPATLEVAVVDDGGAPALSVHAGYAVMGVVPIQVELNDGEASTTVELKIEVTPILWQSAVSWDAPPGPEAREHGSMIVDSDGGQAFLFGGSGYAPQGTGLNDAWRYDVAKATWSTVTPTGDVPPPGASRRVAQIPGTKIAYLSDGYGGPSGNTNFDDLYRVTIEGQGLVFKLMTQMGKPPKRSLHGFGYDAESKRFALFGGASSKPLNDTWTATIDGDVVTWTQLMPPTKPSARYGFFAAMDDATGRLLVFSGAQGFSPLNPAKDTWALDLRSEPPAWEQLEDGTATSVPEGRRNGAVVLDPSGPRLLVWGGTADGMVTSPGLFALDARPGKAAWTRLDLASEPTIRSSCFGFYDSVGDRTLMGFGNTNMIFTDWAVLGY